MNVVAHTFVIVNILRMRCTVSSLYIDAGTGWLCLVPHWQLNLHVRCLCLSRTVIRFKPTLPKATVHTYHVKLLGYIYTLGHLSRVSVTLILAKLVFLKTFCDASVLVFPFRRLIRLHSLHLYHTHEAKAILQCEIKATQTCTKYADLFYTLSVRSINVP